MKCQCGEAEYYHSGMPPRECEGCEKCGTTYAYRPGDHKPIAPHDYVERKVIEDGNETDESYCRNCYVKRKHAEKK